MKLEKQRALRRYLGMVNYYHRFILNCAEKLTPLNYLLTEADKEQTRLSSRSNFDLHWTESANLAFIESKQMLANATLLVHPNPSAPLNSTTERSSLCQTRHVAYITEFTTDVRYMKGETNLVAGALSQPSVSATDCDYVINYKDLSADQAPDTEFKRLRHSTSSTLNFRMLKIFDDVLVWCDVLIGNASPYKT